MLARRSYGVPNYSTALQKWFAGAYYHKKIRVTQLCYDCGATRLVAAQPAGSERSDEGRIRDMTWD